MREPNNRITQAMPGNHKHKKSGKTAPAITNRLRVVFYLWVRCATLRQILHSAYIEPNARNNKGLHFCKPLFLLVPPIGFELMTYRLQGDCT